MWSPENLLDRRNFVQHNFFELVTREAVGKVWLFTVQLTWSGHQRGGWVSVTLYSTIFWSGHQRDCWVSVTFFEVVTREAVEQVWLFWSGHQRSGWKGVTLYSTTFEVVTREAVGQVWLFLKWSSERRLERCEFVQYNWLEVVTNEAVGQVWLFLKWSPEKRLDRCDFVSTKRFWVHLHEHLHYSEYSCYPNFTFF